MKANIPTESAAPFRFQKWGANPSRMPLSPSTTNKSTASHSEAMSWKKVKKRHRTFKRFKIDRSMEVPEDAGDHQKHGAKRTMQLDAWAKLGGCRIHRENHSGKAKFQTRIGSTVSLHPSEGVSSLSSEGEWSLSAASWPGMTWSGISSLEDSRQVGAAWMDCRNSGAFFQGFWVSSSMLWKDSGGGGGTISSSFDSALVMCAAGCFVRDRGWEWISESPAEWLVEKFDVKVDVFEIGDRGEFKGISRTWPSKEICMTLESRWTEFFSKWRAREFFLLK